MNVTDSLLIGFLTVLMHERFDVAPELRAGTLIALLGAFPTFSTFSLETIYLLERGGAKSATQYSA
ncbi:MAG: hypothetical protein M3294_06790 [Pseudomonadota bacterium]|nr:hypothetical protein [Pseudomonadota bacterium]